MLWQWTQTSMLVVPNATLLGQWMSDMGVVPLGSESPGPAGAAATVESASRTAMIVRFKATSSITKAFASFAKRRESPEQLRRRPTTFPEPTLNRRIEHAL
jgi:hypothetical protein